MKKFRSYYERSIFKFFSKKTIRAMKISFCLFMLAIFQLAATDTYSQLTRITLNMENSRIADVLNEIENKTEFYFLYSPKLIDVDKKVNINVNEEAIKDILNEIFPSEVKVVVSNHQIVLTSAEESSALNKTILQQQTITGKVTDASSGDPMPGVNIQVKGTTFGTISDAAGNYSISVPDRNTILVFSFIGYDNQELSVAGRSVIDISLTASTTALSEVVVTGYGTQKKMDITGSVTVVNAEQLSERVAPNFAQQLQGHAPGVVIGTSGAPGTSAMIRIRGIGTVNNNGPLYVIDGVSTTSQDLNSLNPSDIESMQILKDASSASIYGAQASNGVIIITTKKGKVGTPKITYDASYSVSTPPDFYDILNTGDWVDLWWKARLNAAEIRGTGILPTHPQFGSGLTPTIPKYIIPAGSNGPFTLDDYDISNNRITEISQGTDWYGLTTQNAATQNHQLTLSGGSQTNKYFLGLNYFDQDGTFIHTYYKRYSVRLNTETKIRPWLRLGENLTLSSSNNNRSESQSEGNPFSICYLITPFIPVYDIAGNFAGSKAPGSGNRNQPVAIQTRAKDNYSNGIRLMGNLFGEIDFMPDLTFKTSFGLDHGRSWYYSMSKLSPEFSETSGRNQLSEGASFSSRYVFTNTLNYTKTFNVHHLTALIGSEFIHFGLGRSLSASRYDHNFEDDINTWILDGGSTKDMTNSSNWQGETSMFGLFGRLDYDYNNRYLLTAILRRDGSSRFSKSNRYGYFPALSLGWRISEETFMQNVSWIDDLKFRIGYGITGNSEIPRTSNWANEYSTNVGNTNYDLNGAQGTSVTGYGLSRFGNPDTKWETTQMLNTGFDMVLFKGKLETNIEYYVKRTSDMLVQAAFSSLAGAGTPPYVNLGEIENKGFDFNIVHRNDIGDFGYSIGINLSTYKNEVNRLNENVGTQFFGGGTRYGNITLTQAGYPVSQFYGYNILGFYESAADVTNYKGVTGERAGQPVLPLSIGTDEALKPEQWIGKYIFEDVNGDGRINASDKTIIGNPHPDFTGGINLGLTYKNFDLSAFLYTCVGNDIYNQNRWWLDFQSQDGNRSTRMRDYSWEPGRKDALLPILDANDIVSNNAATSYLVEDGSYIRLQTLNLSYTFPKAFVQRIKLDNLKVYVQGINLFTLTDYSGMDPDVTNQSLGTGGDLTKGMDYGKWPAAREFLIGVNVAF